MSREQQVNILLVDDKTENLLALESILEAPGYRLVRALGGHDALLALLADDYAAIVLDVQMPGMTGIEVARSIGDRAHVVFLTANDGFAISAFEEGAVDYMLKPYSAARLYTACHRLRRRLGA